jgi:hypothetical protein
MTSTILWEELPDGGVQLTLPPGTAVASSILSNLVAGESVVTRQSGHIPGSGANPCLPRLSEETLASIVATAVRNAAPPPAPPTPPAPPVAPSPQDPRVLNGMLQRNAALQQENTTLKLRLQDACSKLRRAEPALLREEKQKQDDLDTLKTNPNGVIGAAGESYVEQRLNTIFGSVARVVCTNRTKDASDLQLTWAVGGLSRPTKICIEVKTCGKDVQPMVPARFEVQAREQIVATGSDAGILFYSGPVSPEQRIVRDSAARLVCCGNFKDDGQIELAVLHAMLLGTLDLYVKGAGVSGGEGESLLLTPPAVRGVRGIFSLVGKMCGLARRAQQEVASTAAQALREQKAFGLQLSEFLSDDNDGGASIAFAALVPADLLDSVSCSRETLGKKCKKPAKKRQKLSMISTQPDKAFSF